MVKRNNKVNQKVSIAADFSALNNLALDGSSRSQSIADSSMLFVRDNINTGLSFTEILDMGVRGIELNVYMDQGKLKLSSTAGPGCSIGSDLDAVSVMKEINDWMRKHPKELVFLKVKDDLAKEDKGKLSAALNSVFDKSKVFSPQNLVGFFKGKWPSQDSIVRRGKNIVIMQDDPVDQRLVFNESSIKFKSVNTGAILTADVASQNIQKASGKKIEKADVSGMKELGCRKITKQDGKQCVFIPSDVIDKSYDISVKSNIKRDIAYMAGKIAVSAGLNNVGKVIFASTVQGVEAYNQYTKDVMEQKNSKLTFMDRLDAILKVVPPAVGAGFGVATGLLECAMMAAKTTPDAAQQVVEAATSNPQGYMSWCYSLGANAIASAVSVGKGVLRNAVVATPVIKTVQAALNIDPEGEYAEKSLLERVKLGFLKGIDQSFFGMLFNAEDAKQGLKNQDAALDVAAGALKGLIDKNPALRGDVSAQRVEYDKRVAKAKEDYLKTHKDVSASDLIYPSFDAAKTRLNELSSNKDGNWASGVKNDSNRNDGRNL